MSAGRSFSYLHLLKAIIAGLFILAAIPSCKVPIIVKKYPVQKPFVYETNINLIGNFSNEEKAITRQRAESAQLDDSMRARKLDKLLWSVMKTSRLCMTAPMPTSLLYLCGRCLFHWVILMIRSVIRDTVMKKKTDQYRTYITFDVKPGNQWRLDSISYNIKRLRVAKSY